MDVAVAILSLLFGVLALASLTFHGFTPSKSVENLPVLWVVLVAGFLSGGGMLTLIGLNWAGEDVSTGWALERFGWLVTAGGFTAYGITVLSQYPESVFSWVAPLILGLGGVLRCWSLFKLEQNTRLSILQPGGGSV